MTSVPFDWSVLMLCRYTAQAASSRLRSFQYIPFLNVKGADVAVAPFFDDAYLSRLYTSGGRGPFDVMCAYARRVAALMKMHRASVVWIEKELFPFLPGFFETLPALLRIPYVVDYDDATFHTYDKSSNPFVRSLLSNKLEPLLRCAQAVTVGNSYLETYAREHGANSVVQVPTVVDLTRYAVRPEPVTDEIRVGWIGTPSTAKYLDLVRTPLKEASKFRKIRLVTIGAGPLDDFGVPLEQYPWSSDTEGALLSTMHIGVMPLPDEPWERGKCGYKLIQYMAAGLPVIASPVGANREIVTGDCGVLAENGAAWSAALTLLSGDAVLRRRMGTEARKRVESSYSLQVIAPKICKLLSDVAFGGPARR